MITIHPEMSWAKCIYWMFSILIETKNISRNDLMAKLTENEIETRPFFFPLHIMPPYKNNENFFIAEGISKKGINLPSSVSLKSDEIEFITEVIRKELK